MEILYYPDPRLTQTNKLLGVWSPDAAAKVEEMRKLLAEVGGAGLAAPQVGWNVRLFILSMAGGEGETSERIVFDPTLTLIGDKIPMEEGCLSFPKMSATIERYERVRLIGKTSEGELDEVLIGFEAQAAQHEMDHLDGVLYIERMTPADRKKNAHVIRELEKRYRNRPR